MIYTISALLALSERNADEFYQQRAELWNFDVSFVSLKKAVMRPVTYTR